MSARRGCGRVRIYASVWVMLVRRMVRLDIVAKEDNLSGVWRKGEL